MREGDNMAAIKSKEWLKATLANKNMTQKELAQKTGLSLPAISKIMIGERFGSVETWEKIIAVLGDDFSISVESSDFVTEIYQEILEYGDSYECFVFYEMHHGNIVFKDYLLPEDVESQYKDDLLAMSKLKITLGEAYALFRAQDSII
ncbi:MAG: helix-turn-helix domain-containing protein [Cellulosilyticaceae bacterium]